MQNHYTARQVCLMQRLRQLWEQHVCWTRFFIISTAAGLADLSPVTDRLLQNPKDFAPGTDAVFQRAHGRTDILDRDFGKRPLRRCTFSPSAKFFFTRIACDTMESPSSVDVTIIMKSAADCQRKSRVWHILTTLCQTHNGDTLRCLPSHVKEERTLACTQSANSGVDR